MCSTIGVEGSSSLRDHLSVPTIPTIPRVLSYKDFSWETVKPIRQRFTAPNTPKDRAVSREGSLGLPTSKIGRDHGMLRSKEVRNTLKTSLTS